MQPETQAQGSTTTASCPSTKQLLKDVLQQIGDFEAKKLTELKSELEGFVKKQQQLVDDYRKAYPELKRKWCAQHTDVQTLFTQLKSTHDPLKDPWKGLIARCICAKQKEVDCFAESLAKRKRCCFGPLEHALDQARTKFTDTKARLDILLALSGKVDAALTTHATWIKDVKNLPQPERASVLYLFWFRLLPAHRALKPNDLEKECVVPGDDEAPEKICKAEWGAACPTDPWACTPPPPTGTTAPDTSRRLPWLMPPDSYEAALDCAWDDYRKAKNELAIAEAKFKATPDDLATRVKEYGAAKDGLEADILACLKDWKPQNPCCADVEPAPAQGA